jgi:putative ABC transport system permease protein
VLLYINEEIGHDTHHGNSESIYRLISKNPATQELSSWNNPQIAEFLEERIPEINASASYTRARFEMDHITDNEGFYYADPRITDIFSFNFIEGNAKKIKEDPFAVMVSKSFAEMHFKATSVVGQTIELAKEEDRATYTVGAVFVDFPRKSTFRPTLVLQNYSSKRYRDIIKPEQLGYRGYQSYFKLQENASVPEVTETMNRVYKSMPQSFNWTFSLQPLENVHLYSQGINGQVEKGSIKKVMMYAVIGALILLMSLMNFLLLYTSITKQRFKEIAIRKINGLQGGGLLRMFLVESLIISLVSTLVALFLMYLSIPFFNRYTNSNLRFSFAQDYGFLLSAISLVLVISYISGFYLHRFINNMNSIDVLDRNQMLKTKNFFFGDSAVLFQITIVCAMLTFSIGYYMQLDFMMDSGKGFDSDNVLVLKRRNWDSKVFENEVKNYPFIEAVSRGNVLPLYGSSQIYDISLKEGAASSVPMELMRVDDDYIPLYRIKLLQGRNFSNEYASDVTGRSLIINKSAQRMLNLKNPIEAHTNQGKIIGVVEDFKFESFHKTLRPLFFRMPETTENAEFNSMIQNYGDLMIRFVDGAKEKAINTINKILEDQNINIISNPNELTDPGDRDQTYVLFDTEYNASLEDKIYGSEKTLQKVILSLTIISIFITLFGLVGMSMFEVGRKTKEIAIRKVNGATTKQILILLNKGFTKWIVVGPILAIPISYFALKKWLEGFAYKTTMSWWIFALAGLTALVIALLTVSWQSFKAAVANPVDSLRDE